MSAAPALTLSQMTARRAELAADLEAAQETLDTAREGLITGSSKAQAVTSAQADVNALTGALRTADERVAALTEAEAQRKAEAYRQGLLARLTQGAQEAQEHKQAFTDGLGEALATLAPQLEAAFGHLYDLHDLREVWVKTLKELDRAQPTPGTALALLEAQTDLKAIRTKPLPGSWHHGLTYHYVSTADELTPELLVLWNCYFALVKAGVLPGASSRE